MTTKINEENIVDVEYVNMETEAIVERATTKKRKLAIGTAIMAVLTAIILIACGAAIKRLKETEVKMVVNQATATAESYTEGTNVGIGDTLVLTDGTQIYVGENRCDIRTTWFGTRFRFSLPTGMLVD